MTLRLRLLVLFLFPFFCLACDANAIRKDNQAQISCGQNTSLGIFEVAVAISNEERARGLMYVREMSEDVGMLFIFPNIGKREFWMKNTFISLDMIFFDENGVVVSILEKVPPLTKTARKSESPAKYVLELNGGMASKIGVKNGCTLSLKNKIPEAGEIPTF